jgi:hypothetical protein
MEFHVCYANPILLHANYVNLTLNNIYNNYLLLGSDGRVPYNNLCCGCDTCVTYVVSTITYSLCATCKNIFFINS